MDSFVNDLITKRLRTNDTHCAFRHAACVFSDQHKLPGLW